MFILVELKKGRRGHERKYERSRVTLGSDLKCQIWIPDSGAAAEHVEIAEFEGRLHLRTLPGAAPVRVNGTESVETPLKDGDRIGIGRVEFQVRGPYRRTAARVRWRRVAWGAAILLAAWIVSEKLPRERAPATPAASTPASSVPNPPETRPAILPAPEAIVAGPPSEPASATEQAERVLAYAQSRIAEGQLEEADKVLSSLQAANSDFLPAYSERAALFEKRGDSQQARAQWMEILRRAKDAGSPETLRATTELTRMSLEEFPRHPPKAPPRAVQATRNPPEDPVEEVAILSSEVRRLPPSPDAEDVRILELVLELSRNSPPVAKEEVSVVVRFYDRSDPDGRIRPSSVRNNPQTRSPGPGTWSPGELLQITATYVVPQGMREQDTRAYGGRTSYYGYSIEVRVGNTIRARLHRPVQLKTTTFGRR